MKNKNSKWNQGSVNIIDDIVSHIDKHAYTHIHGLRSNMVDQYAVSFDKQVLR